MKFNVPEAIVEDVCFVSLYPDSYHSIYRHIWRAFEWTLTVLVVLLHWVQAKLKHVNPVIRFQAITNTTARNFHA